LLAGTTIAVAYDEPAPLSTAGVASVIELGDANERTVAATMTRSGYLIAKSELPSNEKEISHGRVSRQAHGTHFVIGPLASAIG